MCCTSLVLGLKKISESSALSMIMSHGGESALFRHDTVIFRVSDELLYGREPGVRGRGPRSFAGTSLRYLRMWDALNDNGKRIQS
jgi:hypothetical protein